MTTVRTLLATLALAAASTAAGAATLTFDDDFTGPAYAEAGLAISGSPGPVTVEDGALGAAGPLAADTFILYELTAGDPFDLVSIDVVSLATDLDATLVVLTGVDFATGTTRVQTEIDIASGTFVFSGFTSLGSVQFGLSGAAGDAPRFDNLTFTTPPAPLPAPAPLPLLAGALGVLALARPAAGRLRPSRRPPRRARRPPRRSAPRFRPSGGGRARRCLPRGRAGRR